MGSICCCISNSADNQDLSQGLVKKRGCTDFAWLLFFIAFIGGMGYVVYICISIGDPYRLLYGVDSWGNTCNRKNEKIDDVDLSGRDMTGLSNTFYFDFKGMAQPKLFKTTVLCVSNCPRNPVFTLDELQDLSTANDTHLCRYDVEAENFVNGSSSLDVCPSLPLGSYKNILNRCVPALAINIGTSMISAASKEIDAGQDPYSSSVCEKSGNIFERVIQDLNKVYLQVAYLSIGSVLVALIVSLLMRFFAAIIIRVLVIGMALGSIAASAYLWYLHFDYKDKLSKIPADEQTEDDKNYVNYWMYGAVTTTLVAVIILLVLLVMRKRIALVIQLFHEAGKAVGKMPMLLIQPVWTVIAVVLIPGTMILFYTYILTAENPVVDADTSQVFFEKDQMIFYMQWYYLLGILWFIQFLFACQTMVIAGAVAYWYFVRDKSIIGCTTKKFPILAAGMRLVRYHLGTVAFGSFIIAVIQLIRIVLMYIQRKLKGRTSKPVKYLLKMLSCCFWCLEKIMKFFTKNAYIMVAIYGCNLCTGGKRGIQTIMNNILRVGAIESIGVFTLFVGKLLIVAIVEVVGIYLYKDRVDICYMYVPLIALGIISFFVAHCFLSVYGMAIDTIFLCFCVDSDFNDGGRKPYFMSKGLMKFVTVAAVTYSREKLEPIRQNDNNLNNKPKDMSPLANDRPKRMSRRPPPPSDIDW